MEGQVVAQGVLEPSAEWLSNSQNWGVQERFKDANLIDLIRPSVDRSRLAAWLHSHPDSVPTFIRALLPSVCLDPDEYALDNYRKAMAWVRWAMLGAPEDVSRALDALLDSGSQGTGACGAQWGMDDIAYRCRDCELDPTCAVCASCFLAGEHDDHDYQMIRTGGGCCDCGDPTAWRREGFCPNHQGPSGGRVELPDEFLSTATPVLKALLAVWVERLDVASKALEEEEYYGKEDVVSASEGTSTVVARELLNLCNRGEALLRFVGQLVVKGQVGLLSVLMGAGRALDTEAETEVHALLYKLLGDPDFKYKFAKVFVQNYTLFAERRGYPLTHFSGFSVQIFTVPLLTARLVLENDLLDILLETLRDAVRPAIGQIGRLEVAHSSIQTQQYSRILSDLKYVLSTPAVAGFAAKVRPELARSFVHFLVFPQGMLPHTRRTGTHIEMESEAWRDALMLETELGMLYRSLVEGAMQGRGVWDEVAAELLKQEGEETERGKEVAGSSVESAGALSGVEGTSMEKQRKGKEKVGRGERKARSGPSAFGDSDGLPEEEYKQKVMASLAEMTREMANSGLASPDFFAVMVGMLVEAGTPSQPGDPSLTPSQPGDPSLTPSQPGDPSLTPSQPGDPSLAPPQPGDPSQTVQKDQDPDRVPAPLTRLMAVCAGVLATWVEIDQVRESRRLAHELLARAAAEEAGSRPGQLQRVALTRARLVRTFRRPENAASRDGGPGQLPGLPEVSRYKPATNQPAANDEPVEWVPLAESVKWPEVHFDVATQPVSFHLPLHRFLAQCFQGAVECTGGGSEGQFLRSLLPAKYRECGFPAAVMEHVLQLQVLNAQIRAGMWRRNGSGIAHLAALYSTNYWCEDSRDLDVFLLQCCAVLAPPEDFVWRVVQRFGLEGYLAGEPVKHEYEPQLAEALLALLVRISAERGLSGLDEKHSLRRELVQRLAREDATYSALSKALPPKLRESKHIKDALRGVATFIKPTGLEPGKFALKDKCWQELDPWALSWERAKLQEAEERFFRATNKSATFALLPKWTDPFPAFASLSQIPTSRAVYDVVTAVLSRAEEGRDGKVTDNALYAALHLLALALDKCQKETGSLDRLPFVQKAVEGGMGVMSGGCSSAGAGSGPKGRGLVELLVRLRGRFVQGEVGGDASKTEGAKMIEGFLRSLATMHEALRRGILTLDPTVLSEEKQGKATGTGPPSEVEQRKQQARARQAAMLARMKAAQAQFAVTMAAGDDDSEPESEAATCVLCRAPASESGASSLCHVVLGQRSRVVAWARRPLPDWRAGIHTEGGPDAGGQYSRMGPVGWGAQGVPGGGDVMGPGGRMLVATTQGALWMNEAQVVDLDDEDGFGGMDGPLEEMMEDVPGGQEMMEAMWAAGGGAGLLAQGGGEGGGAEGAPEPNGWRMVLGGQVLAPGPTPVLELGTGEGDPPGGPVESEDETGDDWEMEEVEDDEEASTLEDFLENIGFVGAEPDHDAGLASGDDDDTSEDSGSPDDHAMPTAAPAAEAIAETNGTAPPGATTAEGASGGREPGPSTPPQDVAGPSNPSPGDERGRAQPTEESQVPAVRAGEVAPAERAPLPGGHQEPVGGGGGPRSWLEELRGGAEGPAVEGGSDAALRDEADADAFRRQLLTTHSAMFPRGGAAAGRGAGGGAGEPEYARLQSLIEGALRQAEVQRETWAGEGSAAAARDSVLVGGIPRVQQEEGVAQALSQALFGRPNGGSDEPGQSTDGNPGAAPEQELEWLRAAAGDDPAVAGPSDDVMRGIYTKYVTYHRGLAEAQPAVQAEAEDGVGLHFRACGHAIHAKCLEGYFQSLHQSSMRRELFEGAHIVSLDAGEFLCPVCRRLANAALPMLPAPPPTAPLTSQPHASPGPDTAGASAAGEIRPGAEYGATSQPVATPGPTPAGASAAGEVPSGADHGATLLPVGFPGPSPVSTSAAGEVSPRAQNGASSSTGVQAVSESPREAQDTGPSSQLEASPGEWKASTPVSDYVRPAVKLILDAEIRTDPQGPYGVDASYWEAGRHSAHIAMEVKGALESFTTRAARLSGRTRPTHSLELWEALGFTVQATELAARRVGGSPEKAAEISDNLGRSVSDAGVSDKGKRAETGAGASGPEESPQVELAPSDVTDYVSKRLQVLGAAAGDEGRSVLRPLAGAAKALRGASIPEQLFRARGLQILAGALLRGKSRDELPSEVTAGHSDRTAAEARFWRLLADPVLFHDPFATLVRLLYVLKGDLPDAEGIKALIRLLHLLLIEACNSRPPAPSNQETSDPPTTARRVTRLRQMSLPFLRQSALLLETLHPNSVPSFQSPLESAARAVAASALSGASRTRVPAPPEKVADVIGDRAGYLEALILESDLGLAPLERIMAAERADVAGPAATWLRHFGAEVGGWRGVETNRGERDARPFELMRLPRNYHEVFQRYVKARCQLCKTVPVQPVLCLVCGAFLCGHSRKACCRVDNRGECYRHASECGVGVGVFLFLRRTTVTLLRNGRQTVWLSPYLDAHGEEDIDLRRGKPLFLSEERYTALTEMVASMGMDHDSQVLARTVRRLPQAIE